MEGNTIRKTLWSYWISTSSGRFDWLDWMFLRDTLHNWFTLPRKFQLNE